MLTWVGPTLALPRLRGFMWQSSTMTSASCGSFCHLWQGSPWSCWTIALVLRFSGHMAQNGFQSHARRCRAGAGAKGCWRWSAGPGVGVGFFCSVSANTHAYGSSLPLTFKLAAGKSASASQSGFNKNTSTSENVKKLHVSTFATVLVFVRLFLTDCEFSTLSHVFKARRRFDLSPCFAAVCF